MKTHRRDLTLTREDGVKGYIVDSILHKTLLSLSRFTAGKFNY